MTTILTNDNLKSLVGKTVVFDKEVEEFDDYADEGMKAIIIETRLHSDDYGDEYQVYFDFTPFEDYNTQFETNNYYDKYGTPCLNAREAGWYRSKDWYYFNENAPFTVIEEDENMPGPKS